MYSETYFPDLRNYKLWTPMNDMPNTFHAIILAAGVGKRYFSTGGENYKQVVPYKGKPIIRRIFDILYAHASVSSVRVVVGDNPDCVNEIRKALPQDNVQFVCNLESDRDNNQLSFLAGTEGILGGAIIVEADCIFEPEDISAIASVTRTQDITWGNIGSLSKFDYGGTIFVDESGNVAGVDVLDHKQMSDLKATKRNGLKMFGIAAFGAVALEDYRKTIFEYDDLYNRYFHFAATDHPKRFSFRTVKMSDSAFSFNVISELREKTQ